MAQLSEKELSFELVEVFGQSIFLWVAGVILFVLYAC